MPKKKEPPSGRVAKDALMKQAREIAKAGHCMGFKHVCEVMEHSGKGGLSLKLWATASDRDEIDRLCTKAREPMQKRPR